MKYLPRLLPYLRPRWKLAALGVLITLLSVGAGLLAPWPLKILFDSVLGNHPLPSFLARPLDWLGVSRFGLLIVAVLAGLLVTLLDSAFTVLNSYVSTKLEQSMILDFRGDLFQHAQRLSLAFHDKKRAGGLIYAINFQADAAAGLVMALQPLAQSALTLVGMFWVLMFIDRQLALLSLIVVPFLYYSVGYYIKHIQTRLMEVKNMEGETISIIHEAISMMRVIVAFGREGHEYRRFRTLGERAVGARVKLTVRQTLFSLAVNLTTAAGTALVLGFGAYFALQGRLTGGDLLVVMAYIAAVYQPLESISYTLGSLQDQIVSLRIAFNLLDTKPEIKDAPDALTIERAQGHVKFEGVNFSYGGRTGTLKNISFEAQPGEVIGIVGQTGAGKSTLVSLLPRFYDPKEGRILLDGHDIQQLTLSSLRAQISIVLQDPLLFSGTIADNIRYGNLEASMEEIIEAAKAANAHDFIMRLPEQYETQLGERGVQISGGERQRVSIARAFLKDAPILILDEPTSAIDSKTEAVILEALERLMEGRTTFMIAHRLSTIRNADRILALAHGELVEQGTHQELLQQEGLYQQLYDLQMGYAGRKTQFALQANGNGAVDADAELVTVAVGATPMLAAGAVHSLALAPPMEVAVSSDIIDGETGETPIQWHEQDTDVDSAEINAVEQVIHPDQMLHNAPAREAALSAHYSGKPFTNWHANESLTYTVVVTNTGSEIWGASGPERVRMVVCFGKASDVPHDGWASVQRFYLPVDLAPGASYTLTLNVSAPAESGTYVLRHRMIKGDGEWFADIDKATVRVVAGEAELASRQSGDAIGAGQSSLVRRWSKGLRRVLTRRGIATTTGAAVLIVAGLVAATVSSMGTSIISDRDTAQARGVEGVATVAVIRDVPNGQLQTAGVQSAGAVPPAGATSSAPTVINAEVAPLGITQVPEISTQSPASGVALPETSPSPSVSPTAVPGQQVTQLPDRSAITIEQVARAASKLQSGRLIVTIDHGNGTRSTAEVRFNHRNKRQAPRLHISSTSGVGQDITVVDSMSIGDLAWIKVGGDWRPLEDASSLRATFDEYMPQISEATDIQITRDDKLTALQWLDRERDDFVTLFVDSQTGIPRKMQRLRPATSRVVTISYAGWNMPVKIVAP